jgi:hypothetical protein
VTGIPKRRYYVVLIVLMAGSVLAFGGTIFYVRDRDRQAAEAHAAAIAQQSNRYDYRSCVDRNELRAVIATILQGALDRPHIPAATPEGRAQERAYRALIKSYLEGGELVPRNCIAIFKRGGHP